MLFIRLGQRINDESSIYYWAAKNKIPVFSPALTDGSLGDMMYFHSHRNPGLVVDILSDLKRLNTMAVKALNSGVIIVGGGLIKHHICNANLMVSHSLFISNILHGKELLLKNRTNFQTNLVTFLESTKSIMAIFQSLFSEKRCWFFCVSEYGLWIRWKW